MEVCHCSLSIQENPTFRNDNVEVCHCSLSIQENPTFRNDNVEVCHCSLSIQENPTFRNENVASSSTPPTLTTRHDPSQPEDQQPSLQGATSSWTSDGTLKIIDFTLTQELLVPAPSNPFEAFRLLLDDNYLDMIVHETNLNAVRVFGQPGVTEKSRIIHWKDLDREELMIFLGLLIHTGTIRLNRLNDYWKKHWLFNLSCLSQYMSRNRFMLILRCLHFTSEPSDEDRLNKIRPVMDHFNNTMNAIYYPGKQLSSDESMVLWRGRLMFRQFIKNKRHKYGIKLYIYGGAGDETAGVGHTQKVVLKLLEEKLDSGHTVKLSDRQTYCTGTLGKSRKGNPIELGTITLRKGENKYLFLNNVHIGKSLAHSAEDIETSSIPILDEAVDTKPNQILVYSWFRNELTVKN
ncbi:hypothetical protein ABMA27_003077 [Loxostege sticticalis]|uniref:PiggyBac transposable element-derived protein domain-containing protein n=1 Tax=Loxostege sticticalis TaxID=481309 RepID=A0ABR3HRV7_LOXSC